MYANRGRNRGTIHIALAFLVAFFVMATVTIGATEGPLAPVNLQVISATEDTIELAWGPTAPSEFFILDVSGKGTEKVTVGWEPSTDTRSVIASYSVEKNGVVVGSTSTNGFVFSGINKKTNSFRICVTAKTASGLESAKACGTISRNAG